MELFLWVPDARKASVVYKLDEYCHVWSPLVFLSDQVPRYSLSFPSTLYCYHHYLLHFISLRSSTTTFLEHHWECLFVKWNIMLAMHLTYVLAPRLCLLLYWSRCIAPLLYQSVQATVWENLKSKKLSCHLAYVDIYVDESSRLKSITSTSNFSLSPFNLWLHL